jgi:menaquinol-cytochrome c reductase iron-sulfur subunit
VGGGWTEAGDVTALPLNKPQDIVFQKKRTDGWKTSFERATAWVLRKEDEVIAFAPQCTHLGCGYQWDDKKEHFLCPCHASTFSIDGQVLSGPAPRPLDRFDVRVEGSRLWLGEVVPPAGEGDA